MIISFREKLLSKELRNLRLLNVTTSVFITVLGFIFEFAYHDSYILMSGLLLSMLMTSNYFFSYYSDFYRKHFTNITYGSIVLIHLWAVFIAYERNFEIEILLPVSISTFTFSLIFDRFFKSLGFIFVITTLLLILMIAKSEWHPQYTITLIALYSGAFLSEEILKRRVAYQNEIQEQEKRYHSLVENMNDGLIYIDSSNEIVLVNDRFCSITGMSKREIIGTPIEEFIRAFHVNQDVHYLLNDISSGHASFRAEDELKKKDNGSVRVRLRAAPLFDEDGKKNGTMLVYTDITDLKNTEDRLKRREEGYRTFIDQSAVGIWRAEYQKPISIDLPKEEQIELLLETGVIIECNDFMAQMYGFNSSDDLVGRKIRDFYYIENNFDRDKTHQLMERFIANHYRISNTESKELDRHGIIRYMLNNNIGIVENRKLVRTWGVQTEITDRKRTERELIETNHELDTFFYKASHDLKGPLASVMGIVNLARLEKDDTMTDKYFDMIETSIRRLDRTLLELIDLARTRKGGNKQSDIHIKTLIEEIIHSLKHLPGFAKIIFEVVADEKLEFFTDKVLLLSVLQNLIHNGVNYGNPEKPWIKIEALRKNKSIEFVISDNGSGIQEKIKDKVFDMFYRGHPDSSGSGLGLFIVKNALDKMNGSIRFESLEGKGTSFYISIPEIQKENI